MSFLKQNKKRKQTLKSVQYGLEIILKVMPLGQGGLAWPNLVNKYFITLSSFSLVSLKNC